VSPQEEQQEEMFNDIVANTNPVFASMPDADDILMVNLFMQPGENFFNIKQSLLQNQ